MRNEDAMKTAFRSPFGNFHHIVMPFGHKNVGATYQRAMTALFHDMMHDIMEDYIDNIVVKPKKKDDSISHLKQAFQRCRQFKLRMNPLKCAFRVSSGKFLGFIIYRKAIDVDLAKVEAIQSMSLPTNQKKLKSFISKVS